MVITTYLSIITLNISGLNAAIERQMDKVICIYNRILLGHKKEWNLTICGRQYEWA